MQLGDFQIALYGRGETLFAVESPTQQILAYRKDLLSEGVEIIAEKAEASLPEGDWEDFTLEQVKECLPGQAAPHPTLEKGERWPKSISRRNSSISTSLRRRRSRWWMCRR